jgi:hypothetical protein
MFLLAATGEEAIGMKWNRVSEDLPETWLLDSIFDRDLGWSVPEDEAPIQRNLGKNRNPYYSIKVGRVLVQCWETRSWEDGDGASPVEAGRLVAVVYFSGLELSSVGPSLLANITFDTKGLPAFGIDREDGQPSLHAAFPVWPDFPVDVARRQLMLCIGLLVDQAEGLLQVWREDEGAENVAPVIGAFTRAFSG